MANLHEYLAGTAELLARLPAAGLDKPVVAAIAALNKALAARKTVLICGNGGSASDAQHIAAELVGRYERERVALPVMALAGDAATLTALGNDYGYERVFSRQVEAHGVPGGVFIGLSTSGKSSNVLKALEAAKTRGMTTIAFTGEGGGPIGAAADILIAVPSTTTARVQEMHICLYHYICGQVEKHF